MLFLCCYLQIDWYALPDGRCSRTSSEKAVRLSGVMFKK